MLPDIDGFRVCEILRRNAATAAIPILILTAWAATDSRQLGLELGALDYVAPPIQPVGPRRPHRPPLPTAAQDALMNAHRSRPWRLRTSMTARSSRNPPPAAAASHALDRENHGNAHAESDFPPRAVTRLEFPPNDGVQRRLDEFRMARPQDDGILHIALLVDQEFHHDGPFDSASAQVRRVDRRGLRARPRRAIKPAQINRVSTWIPAGLPAFSQSTGMADIPWSPLIAGSGGIVTAPSGGVTSWRSTGRVSTGPPRSTMAYHRSPPIRAPDRLGRLTGPDPIPAASPPGSRRLAASSRSDQTTGTRGRSRRSCRAGQTLFYRVFLGQGLIFPSPHQRSSRAFLRPNNRQPPAAGPSGSGAGDSGRTAQSAAAGTPSAWRARVRFRMSWRFWPVKLGLRAGPAGFIIIDKQGGSLNEFDDVVSLDSPPCLGGWSFLPAALRSPFTTLAAYVTHFYGKN